MYKILIPLKHGITVNLNELLSIFDDHYENPEIQLNTSTNIIEIINLDYDLNVELMEYLLNIGDIQIKSE